MKIELCSFSGYKIYPGHGRTLVKIDGKTFKFLSGRTQKAHDLKRNPRKINWTVLYRYLFVMFICFSSRVATQLVILDLSLVAAVIYLICYIFILNYPLKSYSMFNKFLNMLCEYRSGW